MEMQYTDNPYSSRRTPLYETMSEQEYKNLMNIKFDINKIQSCCDEQSSIFQESMKLNLNYQ
jgi:hypothetical protein